MFLFPNHIFKCDSISRIELNGEQKLLPAFGVPTEQFCYKSVYRCPIQTDLLQTYPVPVWCNNGKLNREDLKKNGKVISL